MLITVLDIDRPWQDQDLGGRRPGKSICIVRYGGFGDMIQMSTVLPWLKEHGWRITVNTTERGLDIIRHDPNIDEVIVQQTDQVPNRELSEYWERMAGCFKKFVQFSESIEGSLLALPGRKEYEWQTRTRHAAMNRDYFQEMHKIAGVPLPPRPMFHPSPDETCRAMNTMENMGSDSFVIMWALCGSSVHKAWPYTDTVIARLMLEHPSVKVVFVGDGLCQLLEENWRAEPRVIRQSGRMGIRDTLTLAQHVDMVVGPETGVLNCVAFERIPKVIMLSHSSVKNIGGTWKNTVALAPHGVDCYPCHKLHYSWRTCCRDFETGGALCAAKIHPDRVYDAIVEQIEKKQRRMAA